MTAASQTPAPAGGLGGRHVLAAMAAFFAVIVVADATLIYKAVSTFGGVDNVNAYRDGLAYNERIANATRQAELGWQDSVEVLAAPVRLRVSLKDRDRQALAGLALDATLARPATTRSDAKLALDEVAPGVFEHDISALGDGAWIVDVRAHRKGDADAMLVYQIRRRLWIAP